MRFGGMVPQGWRMDLQGVPVEEQWPVMLDAAERMERAGYESVWVYDHFHTVPLPTQEPVYEAWALMAALAAATDRIRIGQMCTCNSYRLPSYLAKVASSVDVISGGRLEFAIGAGWYEHEYRAYGYDFPRDGVRIAQLGEAVQIIKEMWAADEAHFEGEHYTVAGAINQPKPLQKPHPPLWIAGGGERKTLRLVAEEADYSNVAGTVDTYAHKMAVLDRHCEDVGRDPAEVGRTVHLEILVVPTEADLQTAGVRSATQRGRPLEKWLAGSMTIAGTADQVAERIAAYAAAGCDYFVMYFPDAAWGDTIERFAADVRPQLG
jgi:F420-dependent oxidoreductase-like protein